MRGSHVQENRNVEGKADDSHARMLDDLLPIPLLFALMLVGFLPLLWMPAPWWVAAGLVFYGGPAALAAGCAVWRRLKG